MRVLNQPLQLRHGAASHIERASLRLYAEFGCHRIPFGDVLLGVGTPQQSLLNQIPIGWGGRFHKSHPKPQSDPDPIYVGVRVTFYSGGAIKAPYFTVSALSGGFQSHSISLRGALYSLGGFSVGLASYMQDGTLCYEYNLFEIARTKICAKENLLAGHAKIEIQTATRPIPAPDGGRSPYQSGQ
jgi:hypothetical protein